MNNFYARKERTVTVLAVSSVLAMLLLGSNVLSLEPTQLLNGISPATAITETTVSHDTRGTYLRLGSTDASFTPAIINLVSNGFSPGDSVIISFSGTWRFVCSNPGTELTSENEAGTHLIGVFSSSNTLLAPNVSNRVPGAIDAGTDYATLNATPTGETTDIPQDFRIVPNTGFEITIPAGASHLFLSMSDTHFVDNCGSISVTLTKVNVNPTADAGADQNVNEGDTVTLDGSGSADPDGTIASYLWEQTAGTTVAMDDSSSTTPSFTAPSVGSAGETLTFELTVTDDDGGTSTTPDSIDVVVSNANQLPTADAGADNSVNEGTTGVQLDGTGSSDPDESISSYLWEQTDGPSVTITNADSATATFDAPEVSTDTPLTFKLTVTDNDGGTDEDTVVVTVNDEGNTLLEIDGFYAPVDMNDVINTLKGGKSVPLKFEIFEVVRDGDGNEISRTEITDTSAIQSFTHEETPCGDIESTETDAVETTNSLGTIEPRYDANGGQFIGNWKARSPPGICYTVEVTTEDDSATAYFKSK
jgi:hypothetical protein